MQLMETADIKADDLKLIRETAASTAPKAKGKSK